VHAAAQSYTWSEYVSFITTLNEWPADRVRALIDSATPARVESALARDERTMTDFTALLSPHALPHLEAMALEAQRLTRWHFGRTVGLYVPIYLSNVCGADCTYCGYAVRSENAERRVTLTETQIHHECAILADQGFQSVLLLTGDAPKAAPVDFIARGVEIALGYFPSVAIEVYSLDQEDYQRLMDLGLEGVTIYMETYDRPTYNEVHLLGRKTDFEYRLNAIERAGLAGARRLSIGALLGLHDWQVEGFWTALHAHYLQKTCWQSAPSISFPRLLHTPERFDVPRLVTDKELVQLMLALRLCLPEVGFNVSTRERPAFRDKLIPLGATMMSAGSSTRPGGYGTYGEETLEQFAIEDLRPLNEVVASIRDAGYDPVWKDFDRAFTASEKQGQQ
jgi:2-iminoacetate synthase